MTVMSTQFSVINPVQVSDNDLSTQTVYKHKSRTIFQPANTSRMMIIEKSGVLDFWSDPGEDIYEDL